MAFILLIIFFLLSATPATAQQTEGLLDLEGDVKAQIRVLEQRLVHGSDEAAYKQVVWLRWLIEMYVFVGEPDGVERCYQQILAYYPYDVAARNDYGRFLLEHRGDYARAERQLRDAAGWGRNTDARGLDLGTTYQLLAQVDLAQGKPDSAVVHAKEALLLLDEEASAAALRALADGYLGTGAFDEAAEAYIELITLERALIPEDINALKLFLHKTTRYDTGSVAGLIEKATADRNASYRSRIELEGGKVVTMESADGVVLEGTLRLAAGPGAVLFIPDLAGRRSVFTPFAQLLFIEDLSTLSLDLRGHGGSRSDSLLSYEGLSLGHIIRLADDVVAGFRFLREQTGLDDSHIMIVSAGRGCAVVEKALHEGRISAPVVYLSPVFRPTDRLLKNAVSFHPDLPILFMYSMEDIKSSQSHELYKRVKDFSRFKTRLLDNAGHGVEVLRRDTKALEFFQQWVGKTLGVR